MASSSRSRRSPLLVRALVLCSLGLVLVLYYRPVLSYLSTSKEAAARHSEVAQLRAQKQELEHKLALSTTQEEISREARRIGYIRPGERLYIVKGVEVWRAKRDASLRAAAAAAHPVPAR